MATVEIAKEALDVALMLCSCFVVGLFKLGVADKSFAVFAPVLWLWTERKDSAWSCTQPE